MKGKVPCEVITWYVLPAIRRELASRLIRSHGCSQKEAAHLLGLTDAAVSQYIARKRGKVDLEGLGDEEFEHSARRIVEGSSAETEICRLCKFLISSGALERIEEKLDA
ncbi:MAG: transcriptional regulator [Candidatus Thermoplasmatota archaeon]|nr:transcriptional regulator [Candidatus Thermoplasmatota archaeon]MDD5778944.1 transcriptional regulator [Candidatus Thermoplasmatota archaeon]